jgi:hypothetical protein
MLEDRPVESSQDLRTGKIRLTKPPLVGTGPIAIRSAGVFDSDRIPPVREGTAQKNS